MKATPAVIASHSFVDGVLSVLNWSTSPLQVINYVGDEPQTALNAWRHSKHCYCPGTRWMSLQSCAPCHHGNVAEFNQGNKSSLDSPFPKKPQYLTAKKAIMRRPTTLCDCFSKQQSSECTDRDLFIDVVTGQESVSCWSWGDRTSIYMNKHQYSEKESWACAWMRTESYY